MEISARVRNTADGHAAEVATAGSGQPVAVAARAQGRGSAINGGEFLMLALATCYCNDLYREAARLGIAIDGCEVV
ncbi:MAG TPA: OsmC family peroxiredoxin, partial [Lysobacter sp.]